MPLASPWRPDPFPVVPTLNPGCTGKVRHRSRQAALEHLASLDSRHRLRRDRPHPYFCRACGCWHIGRA